MKVLHLVILSWVITVLIGVFGLSAWYTIWYYQEPVLDEVAQPDSYLIAAVCGLSVLAVSFLLSSALTVFAGRATSAQLSPDSSRS